MPTVLLIASREPGGTAACYTVIDPFTGYALVLMDDDNDGVFEDISCHEDEKDYFLLHYRASSPAQHSLHSDALKKSRFILAMNFTGISFGQTASHS
jgi:hypothetical protein